jgi:ankyrin repeat protein
MFPCQLIDDWRPNLIVLVQALLDRGADCEYTDADGHFPLLLACQYAQSLQLVKVLVRAGADPSRTCPPNPEFRKSAKLDVAVGQVTEVFVPPSLLDIAHGLGQAEVAQYLIAHDVVPVYHDADAPIEDAFLSFARAYGFGELAAAKLEARLWAAVDDDDPVQINTMIAHGVPIDVRNKRGKTPLFVAVQSKKSVAVVDALLVRNFCC